MAEVAEDHRRATEQAEADARSDAEKREARRVKYAAATREQFAAGSERLMKVLYDRGVINYDDVEYIIGNEVEVEDKDE